MFLSDLRTQQASHGSRKDVACPDHASNPLGAGPDDQLIADCRSLMGQMSALLINIEQAAALRSGEQAPRQISLCEADDQAVDLMERIVMTRVCTDLSMQSKHALAELLLDINWYDEPSPHRDRLLLSFILDATRLSYPALSDGHAFLSEDLDATATVIVCATTCLAGIKELAAVFAQKDQEAEHGEVDQDGLNATISALNEQQKTAIEALTSISALSASALHAKRLVLRRMLEVSMKDSDTHQLRVELARSYFGDLRAFFRANAQEEHEALSGQHTIWTSLSSRFRWLTSSVHFR